jgi:co-chaperonin GroES (HSP10)
MVTESQIKYERIIPILDRILIEVINLVGENKEGEQVKLREIANKKILDQKIEYFEITKAMNNCGIVRAASIDAHWVASGDIVFFGKYAGNEILIESMSHLMIR